MADSKDSEILGRIQEIKTRLADQSTNGLVTRAYLDEKMKAQPEKKTDTTTSEKTKGQASPGLLDQFFEATGLKPVIDAFKSSGWIVGVSAALGVLGVKLFDFQALLSGILGKFDRQVGTTPYGFPRFDPKPPEPIVAEAGSQAEKLQKLNKAADELTSSLRELTGAMQQAEQTA
ncbi:hypothetical protein [Streptomyces spongiae]|uniref:Uncharacterized protein n=1 Tax=Streptomyces spongiae TaxID=565072 RepID=A0A5N8XZG1_9ACTN|nr:hypothetical protein [Streptomyces spongiae]MPY64759.1 hypothetical protein [Streptomyces spongiae]